jgi:GT2 family glycosyltransferase
MKERLAQPLAGKENIKPLHVLGSHMSGDEPMQVSVIIPVTRQDDLCTCLRSLGGQDFPHGGFEIILVGKEDFWPKIPEMDIKITKLVENNLHTAVRRNRGVETARAPFLAFVDDDTVLPKTWIGDAIKAIRKNGMDGVCGQIKHFYHEAPFSKKLSGAAIDSFFSEGFSDSHLLKLGRAEFYNMPLCNCMITRKVWRAVGGFNEKAFYYMDDLEFFYIASQLGFKFYHVPELSVRHGVSPFPLKFLKKKFLTRFHVGINTWIFPEAYQRMPFIWVALAGAPLFAILFFLKPAFLFYTAIAYLIAAVFFASPYFKKDKAVAVFLPGVFLLTHATNFMAFTLGLLAYAVSPRSYEEVKRTKEKRFSQCCR